MNFTHSRDNTANLAMEKDNREKGEKVHKSVSHGE